MSSEQGGTAVYLLGAALLCLLLVGALGLAEVSRATMARTAATRALAAALDGAALTHGTDPAATERRFRQLLAANLGPVEHEADLRVLDSGQPDPFTGERFARPVLTARLTLRYPLEYLAPWLPPIPLRATHIAHLAQKEETAVRRRTTPGP